MWDILKMQSDMFDTGYVTAIADVRLTLLNGIEENPEVEIILREMINDTEELLRNNVGRYNAHPDTLLQKQMNEAREVVSKLI